MASSSLVSSSVYRNLLNNWLPANSCDQRRSYAMQINTFTLLPLFWMISIVLLSGRNNRSCISLWATYFHVTGLWSARPLYAKTGYLRERGKSFSLPLCCSVKIYTYTCTDKRSKNKTFRKRKETRKVPETKSRSKRLGCVNNYKTSAAKKESVKMI